MGGGGVNIPQRSWSDEWPTIKQGYKGQINQYLDFTQKDPLLSMAYPFSQQGLTDVTGYQNMLNKLMPGGSGDIVTGLQDIYKNLPSVSGLIDPLTQSFNQLPRQLGQLVNPLQSLMPQMQAAYRNIRPEMVKGQLTGQALRQATQGALGDFAGRGNVFNQAQAAAFLNRDQYAQARQQQAIQEGLSLAGGIGGVTSQIGALRQAQGGLQSSLAQAIQGLRQGDIGMRSGLASNILGLTAGIPGAIQGLRSNALNSLLGTERAGVQSFSQLTNPILSYLSDLFSSNQNAAAAQSVAGANKSGGAMGGAMSSIGSILGAVLPMLAASDERMKEKIRSTGMKSPEGIPIKTFSYKTRPKQRFVGVTAQDVEKKVPSAVMIHPVTGQKFVDLTKLSVPFNEIKEAA